MFQHETKKQFLQTMFTMYGLHSENNFWKPFWYVINCVLLRREHKWTDWNCLSSVRFFCQYPLIITLAQSLSTVANFQQKMKLRKCLQVVELLSSRQNMVSIVFFVMDGWSSFTALVSSLRPIEQLYNDTKRPLRLKFEVGCSTTSTEQF